jgi:hypothetical protein
MTALERLRALRNSEMPPTEALTKLTEAPCVSFVSDHVARIPEIHAQEMPAPDVFERTTNAAASVWLATVADHLETTPAAVLSAGVILPGEVPNYAGRDPAAFAAAIWEQYARTRVMRADTSGAALDDDRRHCRTCLSLTPGGRCMAAYRGTLPGAASEARPIDTIPRRCVAYAPLPNDPDQRTGRDRWPSLLIPLEASA